MSKLTTSLLFPVLLLLLVAVVACDGLITVTENERAEITPVQAQR